MTILFFQSAPVDDLLILDDITFECKSSLDVSNRKIDVFADVMFIYNLLQKLDSPKKLVFEHEFSKNCEITILTDVINFLKSYALTLDASGNSKNINQSHYLKMLHCLRMHELMKIYAY